MSRVRSWIGRVPSRVLRRIRNNPFDQFHLILTLLGSLLGATGCQHHLKTTAVSRGVSSFAFVSEPPPANARMSIALEEPKSGDYFTDARPIEPLVSPLYPSKALRAKAGITTVGVRIMIDPEGRVTDVVPSLLAVTLPHRFDADFQEAIRRAVTQWHFQPAQNFHVEVRRNADGGLDNRVTSRKNVETYFDLSFTFTEAGTVLSGR